jgi:uncharacterized protein
LLVWTSVALSGTRGRTGSTRKKHGIDFSDAISIFQETCLEGPDERSDYGKLRMIAYGLMGPHVIAVVFCWRENRRRIISARKATRLESENFLETVYGKE